MLNSNCAIILGDCNLEQKGRETGKQNERKGNQSDSNEKF